MGTLRKMVEIIAATFEEVTGNAAYNGAPIMAPMCPPQTKKPTAVHLEMGNKNKSNVDEFVYILIIFGKNVVELPRRRHHYAE